MSRSKYVGRAKLVVDTEEEVLVHVREDKLYDIVTTIGTFHGVTYTQINEEIWPEVSQGFAVPGLWDFTPAPHD